MDPTDVAHSTKADVKEAARVSRGWIAGTIHHRRKSLLRNGQDLPVTLQLLSFAAVGAASSIVYGVFYLVFRDSFGPQLTNLIGSALCALGGTLANQRLTFALRKVPEPVKAYVEGIVVYLIGLAASSGVLFLIATTGITDSARWELAAVTAVSLAVGISKFVFLRNHTFNPDDQEPPTIIDLTDRAQPLEHCHQN